MSCDFWRSTQCWPPGPFQNAIWSAFSSCPDGTSIIQLVPAAFDAFAEEALAAGLGGLSPRTLPQGSAGPWLGILPSDSWYARSATFSVAISCGYLGLAASPYLGTGWL